jgi:hypothetical protein
VACHSEIEDPPPALVPVDLAAEQAVGASSATVRNELLVDSATDLRHDDTVCAFVRRNRIEAWLAPLAGVGPTVRSMNRSEPTAESGTRIGERRRASALRNE